MIQHHFFQHVDVGLETMQIVQVDQKFQFHRPIKVGDGLTGTMHVESVVERFGADIVTTRNVCAEVDGTIVMEAFTTLMGHEGDNSISVKWDPETGQVVRTAVGERPERTRGGLVPSAGGALHSLLGVFPVQRAVRRFQIDRTGSARIV